MIDLHTHTTASDGTDSPEQLLARAQSAGLLGLAVTDHDTLLGADTAFAARSDDDLQLIRGIELSTRRLDESDPARRSVHLLGYFFEDPGAEFRTWLESLRNARRVRNAGVARKLQQLGCDVTLEEAEALGRNITGRPHFAVLLRDKGYVPDLEFAFRRYLGEEAPAFVEREDPSVEEGIARIRGAGGVTSLAHPIRLRPRDDESEERFFRRMAGSGLQAIEAWHSDHSPEQSARYARIAASLGLAVTGGSDFHGDHISGVHLGRGRGQLDVPLVVLDELRRRAGD